MDHFVFFAAGYIVFIVILFGYIFQLQQKIKKIQSQIDQLKK